MNENERRILAEVARIAESLSPSDVKMISRLIDENIDVLSEIFDAAYEAGGDECVSRLIDSMAVEPGETKEFTCGSKLFRVRGAEDGVEVEVIDRT